MDKFSIINDLLPFYENLLTNRQQEICKLYSYEDLSLSEISENLSISRNAVFDALNKATESLKDYENKLKLYQNYQKRCELFQCYGKMNNIYVNELITKLEEIDNEEN